MTRPGVPPRRWGTVPAARQRVFTRARILRFTALVSTLDRFALPPMILAISRDLDIGVAEVARAAGAYFLAYGLVQPVWGLIGARIGVVRLLRLTTLVAALASLATALASGATSLALVRVLAGAGYGNAVPTALFYAGTTAPPGERHREVTGLMGGVALGTSVAIAGGGVLAATVGWQAAFLITGGAGLLLWFSLGGLPELPAARAAAEGVLAPVTAVLRSGPARTLLLLAGTEGAVLLGSLTFLPAAVEHRGGGPALAGLITAGYGLAVLVFAPAVGWLTRRVPPAALIAGGATAATAGCALAAVSVAGSAAASAAVPAVLVCVLLGAAWAAMHSTLQTWATEVVPAAGLASVSLFAGALFAGSALGAVLGGAPADRGDFAPIFAVAAALTVPLGAVAAVARARWRPDPGPDPGTEPGGTGSTDRAR